MFTAEDANMIIPELIDQLYELPDGAYASTLSLLRDCGYADEDFMPVIMDIHRALFEAADAENIRLKFVKSGLERTGPIYEAELRVSVPSFQNSHEAQQSGFVTETTSSGMGETCRLPEGRAIWSLGGGQEMPPAPLPNPLLLVARYLEIIFTNDQLWEQFQSFVRDFVPDKDDDFFAYRRDLDCIDIWREQLADSGGCFPRAFYAAVSFLLLAFQNQGHDLNMELMKAYEKLEE